MKTWRLDFCYILLLMILKIVTSLWPSLHDKHWRNSSEFALRIFTWVPQTSIARGEQHSKWQKLDIFNLFTLFSFFGHIFDEWNYIIPYKFQIVLKKMFNGLHENRKINFKPVQKSHFEYPNVSMEHVYTHLNWNTWHWKNFKIVSTASVWLLMLSNRQPKSQSGYRKVNKVDVPHMDLYPSPPPLRPRHLL